MLHIKIIVWFCQEGLTILYYEYAGKEIIRRGGRSLRLEGAFIKGDKLVELDCEPYSGRIPSQITAVN